MKQLLDHFSVVIPLLYAFLLSYVDYKDFISIGKSKLLRISF